LKIFGYCVGENIFYFDDNLGVRMNADILIQKEASEHYERSEKNIKIFFVNYKAYLEKKDFRT
jgi:iron only hydrogenase large subunit-like protein